MAEDELTPLLEVVGAIRSSGVRMVFEPQVMMTVGGVLSDVLDLTDSRIQSALGTTRQELTGEWMIQQADFLAGKAPMPPTQMLGQAAFGSASIVGLRYPSSKNPTGVGIAVFTTRLLMGRQSLRVYNQPSGKLQQSLP